MGPSQLYLTRFIFRIQIQDDDDWLGQHFYNNNEKA